MSQVKSAGELLVEALDIRCFWQQEQKMFFEETPIHRMLDRLCSIGAVGSMRSATHGVEIDLGHGFELWFQRTGTVCSCELIVRTGSTKTLVHAQCAVADQEWLEVCIHRPGPWRMVFAARYPEMALKISTLENEVSRPFEERFDD